MKDRGVMLAGVMLARLTDVIVTDVIVKRGGNRREKESERLR